MRALLFAAAATLAVLTASSSEAANIAIVPISRLQLPWWKARFEAKEAELRAGPVDMVWLGDSITQDWERRGPPDWQDFAPAWRHFYGGRHAVNLGFKGDSTCHLLWRIEHGELDGIHPKVAVLLIGANNFGLVHTDAVQTFAGIQTILDVLSERLPETKIVVIGVLPSVRSPWVTANTNRLNAMLAANLSTRRGTRFVDASSIFERNGTVDPSLFLDPRLSPPGPPLHPDATAQARIAAMIEPIVASDLGDAERAPFAH